jgi:hypothetical protein
MPFLFYVVVGSQQNHPGIQFGARHFSGELLSVHSGEIYIHYSNIGMQGLDKGKTLLAVLRLADNSEARFKRQRINHTLSEEWMIIDYYDANIFHHQYLPRIG